MAKNTGESASIFDNPKAKSYHPFFAFKNVGDKIEGVYVKRRVKFSDLAQRNQAQYLIETAKDGSFWVAGRREAHPGDGLLVIADMEDSYIGDMVGLIYEKDVPSQKAGYHPFKLISHFLVRVPGSKPADKDEPIDTSGEEAAAYNEEEDDISAA